MTCREKLAKEYPERADSPSFGGCEGCPPAYEYMDQPDYCPFKTGGALGDNVCAECWDREIPEEKAEIPDKRDAILFWEEAHTIIDEAVEKRDRSILITYNPETGFGMGIYPWPDFDDLYDQYEKGRITANDFREKMGLPRVKNAEQFMKKE